MRLPIDLFFRALAADQVAQAIGIILSGTGSDGTLGLKAIKEAGGLVIVQSPDTAAYEGKCDCYRSGRLCAAAG
jgi:two-component system CheB/CheR fusion protein